MGKYAGRSLLAVVALAMLTGCQSSAQRSALPTPPTTEPLGNTCAPLAHAAHVHRVHSAMQLQDAFTTAQAGDVIAIAPGSYSGRFVLRANGTVGAPISVCANGPVTLDGGNRSAGYALHLTDSSYVHLIGFGVIGAQKGIVIDAGGYDELNGLTVSSTGEEAVHLRDDTHDDTLRRLVIFDTGKTKSRYGEGIYVGTAHENWCTYTSCQPDRVQRIRIVGCRFGPQVTAEDIDIKEGTSDGQVLANHFGGAGKTHARSWVDVKGNNWTLEGNSGVGPITDGFDINQVYPGWGLANVVRRNNIDVGGSGYGVRVEPDGLGALITCDNIVSHAGSGFSTVSCRS